ncbi:hypothetical protein X801_02021 [Opisthorchis viverrini]|nr:hypothetical protein X801_02021 [Opisthorchis viverrini]
MQTFALMKQISSGLLGTKQRWLSETGSCLIASIWKYSTLVPARKAEPSPPVEQEDKGLCGVLDRDSRHPTYDLLSHTFHTEVNRKGGVHLSSVNTSLCPHNAQSRVTTFVVESASPPMASAKSESDTTQQSATRRILKIRSTDLRSHPHSTRSSTNYETNKTGFSLIDESRPPSDSGDSKCCMIRASQTNPEDIMQQNNQQDKPDGFQ